MVNTKPLASYKASANVNIKKIEADSKTQVRLLGMGIGSGSNLEVLRNRSGDMVLATGNIRISLGSSVAEKIWVSAIETVQ